MNLIIKKNYLCQGCVRDFGEYFFFYWTNKDITGQTRNIPLTPSPFNNLPVKCYVGNNVVKIGL